MLTGQNLKGEEREQQRQPADHAGNDGTWIPQFDCEAQHPERQQQIGDLRVRDRAEKLLTPRHVYANDLRVGRFERRCSAVEAFDRPAVELPQQIVEVLRHEIDQRRRGSAAPRDR